MKSPTDQASVSANETTLVWHPRIHSSSYALQVSLTAGFDNLFMSQSGSDTLMILNTLTPGTTYYWHVRGSNIAGDGAYSETRTFRSAALSIGEITTTEGLQPAYPNPFYASTNFTCSLDQATEVYMVILNSLGETIRILIDEHLPAGIYPISWNGLDNSGNQAKNGLYFCVMQTGGHMYRQKLLLIR